MGNTTFFVLIVLDCERALTIDADKISSPTKPKYQFPSMPDNMGPMLNMISSVAPSIVPITVPLPPKREVPPMTVAAMAMRLIPVPDVSETNP